LHKSGDKNAPKDAGAVQKEGEEVAKKHLKDRKEAEIGGLSVKKYVKKNIERQKNAEFNLIQSHFREKRPPKSTKRTLRYKAKTEKYFTPLQLFSRERSSTGSNDCFVVVLVVLVVVLSFSHFSLKVFLCRAMAHFEPSRGT
jgi:hypothetical protein